MYTFKIVQMALPQISLSSLRQLLVVAYMNLKRIKGMGEEGGMGGVTSGIKFKGSEGQGGDK